MNRRIKYKKKKRKIKEIIISLNLFGEYLSNILKHILENSQPRILK
jgi:hypothetical protein